MSCIAFFLLHSSRKSLGKKLENVGNELVFFGLISAQSWAISPFLPYAFG